MWDMTKCLIRTTQHVLSSAYIRPSNCLQSVKSKTLTTLGASLAVTYVPIYMYYAVRFWHCAFRVAVTLLDVQYIKLAWVAFVWCRLISSGEERNTVARSVSQLRSALHDCNMLGECMDSPCTVHIFQCKDCIKNYMWLGTGKCR